VATVTAIGTAAGNKLLAAKADTAITTIAGGNLDAGLVNKFHDYFATIKKPRTVAGLELASAGALARWLDAHHPPLMWTFACKHNGSIDFSEQGVVSANANVLAGMKMGTTLTY